MMFMGIEDASTVELLLQNKPTIIDFCIKMRPHQQGEPLHDIKMFVVKIAENIHLKYFAVIIIFFLYLKKR